MSCESKVNISTETLNVRPHPMATIKSQLVYIFAQSNYSVHTPLRFPPFGLTPPRSSVGPAMPPGFKGAAETTAASIGPGMPPSAGSLKRLAVEQDGAEGGRSGDGGSPGVIGPAGPPPSKRPKGGA